LTRNGMIDSTDLEWLYHTNTAFNIWRIWLNDDQPEKEDGVLKKQAKHLGMWGRTMYGINRQDNKVNGVKDCINFFPLRLGIIGPIMDIPDFLKQTPYYVGLKNEGVGLNALLNPESVTYSISTDALHRNVHFAKANENAKSTPLTEESKLPNTLAAQMVNELKDVIYVEGTRNGKGTLALRLGFGNWERAHIENTIRVEVSDVEDFFLHTNLRNACGDNSTKFPTRDTTPALPDALCNNTLGFWVHGFNTNAEEADAWHARNFKHLYQSGSYARFHGVSWFGNSEYGLPASLWLKIVPNYYQNVKNAFKTAPDLAALLKKPLAGQYTKTVVSAHSLGNMVVSSALKDHGALAHVDLYNALNSAVASEAYDAGLHNTNLVINGNPNPMIHYAWRDAETPVRAYAAQWHKLWPDTDIRSSATWAGRFDGLAPIMHNYAAPRDEVFEVCWDKTLLMHQGSKIFTGEQFRYRLHAWQQQEIFKGRQDNARVRGLVSSLNMGWRQEWWLGDVTNTEFASRWANGVCYTTLPDGTEYPFREPTWWDSLWMKDPPECVQKHREGYALWIADLTNSGYA